MKINCLALAAALLAFTGAGWAADKTKIVFVYGPPSHAIGAHEHRAGSMLLAKSLKHAMPEVETVVTGYGWPDDTSVFDGAAAIVIYCDGGSKHILNPHLEYVDSLAEKGVGLVCLHYGIETPKGKEGDKFLDWIGGYFEADWSVAFAASECWDSVRVAADFDPPALWRNAAFNGIAYTVQTLMLIAYLNWFARLTQFFFFLSSSLRGGEFKIVPMFDDPMKRLGLAPLGGIYNTFLTLVLMFELYVAAHRVQQIALVNGLPIGTYLRDLVAISSSPSQCSTPRSISSRPWTWVPACSWWP